MDVGSLLEGPVHSGDEIDLILEGSQGLHRGREPVQLGDGIVGVLFPQGFHDSSEIPFWDDVFRFSREEPSSHHSDGDIEVRHPLGHLSRLHGSADTFQPREGQGCAADAAKEVSS